MAKAFKCDNCGEIWEGVPERRTPVIDAEFDTQVVVFIDVIQNGISGLDFCNNCLRKCLNYVLKGIQVWPQAQVGQVGGVDIVDSANLLRGTTGRNHMRVVDPDDQMTLEDDE